MLSRLFGRTTQSSAFIPEIDGLRFFAIITVVVFHLNTAYSRQLGMDDHGLYVLGGRFVITSPGWWISRLDLGVKVFFAISGMVLAIPFLKSHLSNGPSISLKDYYYRRLTRLEPPFVLSLLGFFVVHLALMGRTAEELWPHLATGLLYAHTLAFGTPNPINPVTWSLETEAQFYLIVPLLFHLIFRTPNIKYRVALILGLSAFSLFFKNQTYHREIHFLQHFVMAYFTNFMTGILFAWLYLTNRSFFQRRGPVWDAVGLAGIFLLFYFYKPQADYQNGILFNAGVFALMMAAFKGSGHNWFFTRPFVYVVGGMCYSIYLLHYAFLHLLVRYTADLHSGHGYLADLVLQLFIALPLVLAVSGAFFLAVEKPCMDKRWPDRLMARIKNLIKPMPK